MNLTVNPVLQSRYEEIIRRPMSDYGRAQLRELMEAMEITLQQYHNNAVLMEQKIWKLLYALKLALVYAESRTDNGEWDLESAIALVAEVEGKPFDPVEYSRDVEKAHALEKAAAEEATT
jgi:hypothetical protein